MRTQHLQRLVVGMTGTRKGLSVHQCRAIGWFFIMHLEPLEMHHGGAHGADTQFHELTLCLALEKEVIVHPAERTDTYQLRQPFTELPREAALKRNRTIVESVELMLCFPDSLEERLRSGTWATIRMCRELGRQHVIYYPDGTRVDEFK